jgi:hypothetical protein
MKADGIEYEERMALLEDVGHPQPLRDLLEVAYDAYRRSHPWVLDHELKPKSVIREMLEQGMGFADLIQTYGLTRSEGAALRYLSDGYRALRAGVPPGARTEEVDQIAAWLGEVVRQTDSSLLEEWEGLNDPDALRRNGLARGDDPALRPGQAAGVTGNERAFRVMVRNAMFRLVQLAARERYEDLAALPWASGWSSARWADALAGYWDEYGEIGAGPDARGPGLFMVDTAERRRWSVRQILADPDGHQDYAITAIVDLDASDEAGEPVVTVTGVG